MRIGLWARGRLDVGWRDLLFAILAPLLPGPRPQRVWPTRAPHLALLSVRTAWDVLLCTQKWPQGSEIIFSEANIPGMVQIIKEHGFVPVAVPVDPPTLKVEPNAVQAAITERTRAILMSPLFGSRMAMQEIGELARQHNLLLVEDNAQTFGDVDYQGSPEADVALFSFGLIKTRTALSGAVVFARDSRLLEAMGRQVRAYPRVGIGEYYTRLGRAIALQCLSHPLVFAALWSILQRRGIDPDIWLSQATRGMKGNNLLASVRRQPHSATLKLLRRRLHDRNTETLQRRVERGHKSAKALATALGREADDSVFWTLPVTVRNRQEFVRRARKEGFDISFRTSSVACHSEASTPLTQAMESVVFLPVGTPMPTTEWERLLRFIDEFR